MDEVQFWRYLDWADNHVTLDKRVFRSDLPVNKNRIWFRVYRMAGTLKQPSTSIFPVSGVSDQALTVLGGDLTQGLTTSVDRALQTTAGRLEWLTLMFREMNGEGCQHNCSGHGSCDNGQCVCMVRLITSRWGGGGYLTATFLVECA